MSPPTWLVTGVSGGLGQALALRILSSGHRVIGSVRSKTKAAEAVQQIEQAGGSIIELDMTDSKENITASIQAVGRIDYLVNNAGYSILAPCEDISAKEASVQMATNFFGPLYTMQAALPGMRGQRSGTIVNVSSVAAKDPQPACSLYCASKAALEAASESLAKEVAPHNISVLIVEPGAFRTNFVTALADVSPDPTAVPAHYENPVGAVISKFLGVHGKQSGDPNKAAERIFEAVTGEGMAGHLAGKVLRLVLGQDSLDRIRRNNDAYLDELKLQEDTAPSTAFTS